MICIFHHKIRFPTQAQAEEAAQQMADRDRVNIRVYQCPHCRGWHRTRQFRGAQNYFRPRQL